MNRTSISLALTLAFGVSRPAVADGPSGEQIYRKQCLSCHGMAGEGVKDKYPQALVGDRSVPQLAKYIARTMPEDDPGSCKGPAADKVAAYIHDTFYSPAARERNKPPRVELSRLTVRQYRYAVADLIGSFRGSFRIDDRRGLKAEYFKSRRFNRNDRMIERTDPEVTFDFGTKSPGEKIEPAEFSVRWTGSVIPPQTGSYEFVVRTEHAANLFVNDMRRPLIDAWVKSGNDTEYRGSITLVGGRAYPLRLEYSKGKQGVDDSKKQKTPPAAVKSSIHLLWKPPHGPLTVVPNRSLSPLEGPSEYVVGTAFPPDDRSYGWERGTAISKEWDQATTEAALDIAGYVASRTDEWAGIKATAPKLGSGDPAEIDFSAPKTAPDAQRTEKLKEFATRFAKQATRRPLTDAETTRVAKQFEGNDPETAVKRAVLLTLKSPGFLYRETAANASHYNTAARLSFGLWDSIPDQTLLQAAAAGKLATREQVRAQADRMLADPRATAKLHEFLLRWLKADKPAELAKDPKRFAGFDEATAADLRLSLELTLADVLASPGSDFRKLLTSDDLFLNGRLAKFYGADLPADAAYTKVKFQPENRAGVLTHPYLLAAFAYTGESSPIHRGVFLARGILGMSLRPPPDAVTPLAPSLHPSLSTRERVTMQTSPTACVACHGIINPLGFTLERFDAVGRLRDKDNAKPVDPTGSYLTRTGDTKAFTGADDLAQFLAGSEEVHAAFCEQLFHHLIQQSVRAYGPDTLAGLRTRFAANGFDIKKLAADILTTTALTPTAPGAKK